METKEVVQKRFSRNLKLCRSVHKMTQKQSAEAIGVKLNTYAAWEEGRAFAPPNILISVSNVFKLSIDDFFKVDILPLK